MLKRWLQREIINAINIDDIEKILIDLGILDTIKAGEKRCETCDCVISVGNIQCLYAEENEIKFCCSKIECYELVLKKQKGE